MTHAQERTRLAFDWATSLKDEETRTNFRILIFGLETDILRSGLSTAISIAERDKSSKAVDHFFEFLAAAETASTISGPGKRVPQQIRTLDTSAYMHTAQEVLRLVTALRRAIQIEYGDEENY